jgi:hypothetical protein
LMMLSKAAQVCIPEEMPTNLDASLPYTLSRAAQACIPEDMPTNLNAPPQHIPLPRHFIISRYNFLAA